MALISKVPQKVVFKLNLSKNIADEIQTEINRIKQNYPNGVEFNFDEIGLKLLKGLKKEVASS